MAGPLDYVNPPAPMGMDPFFLAGLGMLGQAGQPGAAGIGQGAMQGMLAYSQMQGTEAQNQLARQKLAQASRWGDFVRSRPPEEQRMLEALGPEAGADYIAKLGVQAAKGAGGAWQGSGFQAQAANTYNRLMSKAAAGESMTPEEQNNLSIAYQTLTAPKTLTTPEGTYTYPGMQLPAPAGLTGAPSLLGPPAAAAGRPSGFTPKPPTESERKTRSFYERASASQAELAALEEQGYDPSALSPGTIRDYIGTKLKESPSTVTSLFGSFITSPEADLYATASGDFIASMLRYDSGAAVPETEFARYFTTYFPVPGDGPAVKSAKAARRAAVVRALNIASGSLSDKEFRDETEKVTKDVEEQIPLPEEPATAAPATPAAGNLPVSEEGHLLVPY